MPQQRGQSGCVFELFQPLPVNRQDNRLCDVMLLQVFEHSETIFLKDASDTHQSQTSNQSPFAGRHGQADFVPGAPIDALRWEAVISSVVCKRIEERVGGRVVSLSA